MANVTVINQKTRIDNGTRNLEGTIKESVRARCRTQLTSLCGDFFDAVDDFLFTSGSKGQFTQESNYLSAMRELRAKQNLFEKAFIDITVATLFPSGVDSRHSDDKQAMHLVDRHAEVYEMLEIDLALQAMRRKADKTYAGVDQQLAALLTRVQFETGKGLEPRFALVNSCLWSLGEAQRVFALPLEIRLVIIKLFEQHFLLKLERLYLDVISIVKHVLGKSSIGNRLLASSQIIRGINKKAGPELAQFPVAATETPAAGNSTLTIDNAVDDAVTGQSSIPNLPAFVAEMIRCKWRTVLFLIGINRGCAGQEWRDAIAAMKMLTDCTSGRVSIAPTDLDVLLGKLCKGFSLLQMPESEQSGFVQQVRVVLQNRAATACNDSEVHRDTALDAKVTEASLSPSGKKVLDREDLDEISSLLGGEEIDISKSAMERQLMDCLPEIDQLLHEVDVEYKINGNFQTCSIQKNPQKPGMFNITDRHSRTTITRSRLGLAISLHEGELKLPLTRSADCSSEKTLIESGTA